MYGGYVIASSSIDFEGFFLFECLFEEGEKDVFAQTIDEPCTEEAASDVWIEVVEC